MQKKAGLTHTQFSTALGTQKDVYPPCLAVGNGVRVQVLEVPAALSI